MKKVVLLMIFVVLLCGSTFAANEEIVLYEGEKIEFYSKFTESKINEIYGTDDLIVVDKISGEIEAKNSGVLYISTDKAELIKVIIKSNIEDIYFVDDFLNVFTGDYLKLDYKVSSVKGLEAVLKFESDKPSVATVDNDGMVHVKGSGRAIITVSSSDGKKKDSIVLSSSNFSKKIIIKDFKDSIFEGEEFELTASVVGTKHINTGIVVTSNKSDIVKVIGDSTIKALKAGEVLLRIESQDKNIGLTKKVRVLNRVKSIDIVPKKIEINDIGKVNVKYNVDYLEGASTENPKLVWTTTNPDIAKVDQYGNVEGIRDGETLLVLKYNSSKILDTSTIVVSGLDSKLNKEVTSLEFNDIRTEAYVGEKVKLEHSYSPSDADIDGVSFTTLRDYNRILTEDGDRYVCSSKASSDIITASLGDTIFDRQGIKFKSIIKSFKIEKTGVPIIKNRYLFYLGESYLVEPKITLLHDINDNILSDIEKINVFAKGKPLLEYTDRHVYFRETGEGIMQVVSSDESMYELVRVVVESAFADIDSNIKSSYNVGETTKITLTARYKDNLLKDTENIKFDGDITIFNEYLTREYVEKEMEYEKEIIELLSDSTKFDIRHIYDELTLHRDRLSKLNYISRNNTDKYLRLPKSLKLKDREGQLIEVASYKNGYLYTHIPGLIDVKAYEKGSDLSIVKQITIE